MGFLMRIQLGFFSYFSITIIGCIQKCWISNWDEMDSPYNISHCVGFMLH